MKKNKRLGLTSVQIRPQIIRMLTRYIKTGRSKSEVINEALREYLIERELEEVIQSLVPYARAKGIYTEEDVDRFLKE